MNDSFAIEGIVNIVSSNNGVTVFSLDPVLPYRVDMTCWGGGIMSLLVRQNICWHKLKVLPANSVGMLDPSVQFEYMGKGMISGKQHRLFITEAELARYMALPSGTVSNISVDCVI